MPQQLYATNRALGTAAYTNLSIISPLRALSQPQNKFTHRLSNWVGTAEDKLCTHTTLSLAENNVSFSHTDTHTQILYWVFVCHLLLRMVTHHYHAISSFLHADLQKATVPDKDTLFKPQQLILIGLDIPSKTHNEATTGLHSLRKQWKESYFQHHTTNVKTHENVKQRWQRCVEIRQAM